MTNLEIVLRLLTAILCGGIIGYEREFKDKPAGFITHMLVCVGACIISLVQVSIVSETITLINKTPSLIGVISADSGRIIAQIVSGIGFLGAGTIIHFKGTVKGLTTAATLWVVASIGIASGMGYFLIAFLSTFFVFIILIVFKNIEHHLQERRNIVQLEVHFNENFVDVLDELHTFFELKKIRIRDIIFDKVTKGKVRSVKYILLLPYGLKKSTLIESISLLEAVDNVIERH